MQIETIDAVVLAGGLGTRLRGAYDGPKCMAPVRGRPFLEYVLYELRSCGFHRLILCVGHKRDEIISYFKNGQGFGMEIHYAVEPELLGTAGALANASKLLTSDPILVLNGDSFFQLNFAELVETHIRRGAVGTVAVRSATDSSRYGVVEADNEGRIVAFREKESRGLQKYINGGVYVMSRALLGNIPPAHPSSLEREIFPAAVEHGLYACPMEGFFIDIGIPSDLLRAQAEMPDLQRCNWTGPNTR
jgi:NDP-sugar pyrophosphorylase family protein